MNLGKLGFAMYPYDWPLEFPKTFNEVYNDKLKKKKFQWFENWYYIWTEGQRWPPYKSFFSCVKNT
jgi:hypothetical protein